MIIENYAQSPPGAQSSWPARASGAPWQRRFTTAASVTGSITVATTRAPTRSSATIEQEVLTAFAEHASLAITDAKRVEHIQQLAFHDELTGLPNRGLFLERLDQALIRAAAPARARRRALPRPRPLQDDQRQPRPRRRRPAARRAWASGCASCLRDEDTASRLGGDEFAILAHCDRAGAVGVAERILAAMEPPFLIDLREVSAAASIGIALDRGGRSRCRRTMLRDADTAMYRAKFGQRRRLRRLRAEHARGRAGAHRPRGRPRTAPRRAARCASTTSPSSSLSDRRVVGVEALIRWHHPTAG